MAAIECTYASGGTQRAGRLLVVAIVLVAGAGCAVVKPYQRGALASADMNPDPHPAERKTDSHVHEYREGSIGGSGVSGGGCGCN